ncbi:MAG: TonB family protein [Candidatus Eremiobacteraeota bacterium]|nr:TonB family protein [Candidatus Eremiobacteraeota bacterium]
MIVSVLVNGLWEGAPIVAIAWLLSATVSKRNATTRYAVWYAALLAVVVVPILTTTSNAGAALLNAFHADAARPAYTVSLVPIGNLVRHDGEWFERFIAWIVGAWLAGAGANLLRLGASFLRIGRIRRNARPLAGADSNVYLSDDVAVPIVAGILEPRIVLPERLTSELTHGDLQRVIAHERAHIRRNDAVFNLIARLIEALLFFNPWVYVAVYRASQEREAACDDWVVEENGNADDYAACLAAVAQTVHRASAPLLTPSAFRSRHALVARIERLGSTEPRRLTLNAYVLGGVIVIFTALTLALQAFSPALALAPPASGTAGLRSAASLVAATCAHPNAEATVVNAVAPTMPHGTSGHGTVNVAVTIGADGHVLRATVAHSSGNASIDQAVVEAARRSTYSPKVVNCTPVQGSYLFHVEYQP